MSAVAASALSQRFGMEVALDAVDLTVDTGEHLAVLGENGAGKTTLLRIIATAARPTSGKIAIFGLDASSERRRLRARIGYVAHTPGLYPALSAAENLEFCRASTAGASPRCSTWSALATSPADRPESCRGALSSGLRSAGRSCTTPPCWCWTSPMRASTLVVQISSRGSCETARR